MKSSPLFAMLMVLGSSMATPLAEPVADVNKEPGALGTLTTRTPEDTVAEASLTSLLEDLGATTPAIEPRQGGSGLSKAACIGVNIEYIWDQNRDFYLSVGVDEKGLEDLFLSGGLLVFGGELSDFARRITWMTLAISVMLSTGTC
jgi:hypothetical protein